MGNRGSTLPDVTLIPAIASFFGVSTDELFDFNLYEVERAVEAIVNEHCKYYDTDKEKCEAVLREGLKKYPGNDVLLNCLVGVLPIPERSDEVIRLCKQLIQNTRFDDVKYDAYRILAEAYKSIGEYALTKEAIEHIPEIYFSKLEVEAQLLDGEEAWVAAHKELGVSLEHSLRMLFVIGQHQRAKGQSKEAKATYMRAIKLLEAIEADLSNPGWREYYEQFDGEIKNLAE